MLTKLSQGILTWFSIFLIVLFSISAFASEPVSPCKDRESYDKEFAALDLQLSSLHPRLESWEYLHRFYLGLVKRFPECDDGVRSQRLSAEVMYLLAYYWNEFDQFLNAVRPDNDFANFMLAHIDSSGERKYLEQIVTNTRERCSKTAEPLCSKIRARAGTAISQLRLGDQREHSRQ